MKAALLLMMRGNGAFLIEVKVDNFLHSQYTENIMFYKNISVKILISKCSIKTFNNNILKRRHLGEAEPDEEITAKER